MNMKTTNFNVGAYRIRPIAIALAISLTMISCKGGKSNQQQEANASEVEQSATNSQAADPVAAAFKQFGLDLEKVKPNVAEPYEVTMQYGNKVDQTVYYRKAAWKEKSETDIDKETGTNYNKRMFDYIKSISADGKIYTNKTMSDLKEVENYSELKGLLITWSFKYNGMWIDVYPDYKGLGKEIGISLNGSGSY